MSMSRSVAMAAIAFALIQLDGLVEAGYVSGLSNTGVDAAGNPLANGAVDAHYQFVAYQAFGPGNSPVVPASSSTYAVNPSTSSFPIPPWHPNDAASSWISADPSITNGTSDPDGYYAFKTTFTVTGSAAGLSIKGLFSADDRVAYLLNPTSAPDPTTLAFTPDQGYASLYNFSINSGFKTGENTLYFIVANTHGGPEGLRVEFSSVPEPASLAMVGFGLLGVVGHTRYRRSRDRAALTA